MTNAPGIIVKIPAAAIRPQSTPSPVTVRVSTAEIGFASVMVKVRAINSSTQENIKQKNAATPMPDLISGMNIRTKNLGKE